MKYFTLAELTASATANARGIDNTPPDTAVANLENLVHTVLDPARQLLGAPIYVNSGYRCAALNRAVGGAPRSYHLSGRAADITTGTCAGNRRLFAILASLPHTELINECNLTWIHVAI